MSLFTIAGAAQLAALGLLQEGATIPVILLAGLLINLRYVVFSVSLTPHVSHLSRRWRAVIAYPLFDVTYALAAARFREEDDSQTNQGETRDGSSGSDHVSVDETDSARSDGPETGQDDVGVRAEKAEVPAGVHRGWYYLGVAVPMAGSFVLSTLVGALVGQTIGTGLHLDFFIPLLFLALLVPTVESREAVATAAIAAVVAVGAAGLPFNLGLLVGLVSGTAAGMLGERTAVPGGSQ